jgi:AcrR family transcriptional regulator
MTVELRHSPKQARSTATLELLAEAGREIYNVVGRDRLTTAMIAERAGTSIGTFYRYFDDRVALLDHIAPDRDQTRLTEADYGIGGRHLSINVRTGDWVGGVSTLLPGEGAIIASSALPGWPPKLIDEAYGAWLSADRVQS